MKAVIVRLVLFAGVIIGVLFGAAGRWDLPWFWLYVATLLGYLLLLTALLPADLRRERLHPGAAGAERWFRPATTLFGIVQLVVAALDAGRFGWSTPPGTEARGVGYLFYVAGLLLAAWAMLVNRFFSPVIRIQSERGHQLVRTGPYAIVRHPGYLGAIIASLSSGLFLGSWWSYIPAVIVATLFVVRTSVEDRFLKRELPGYADFARQVRWRLLPGLW